MPLNFTDEEMNAITTLGEINTIGLDLAKHVFQVHGAERAQHGANLNGPHHHLRVVQEGGQLAH
jgi:hypothetical protein